MAEFSSLKDMSFSGAGIWGLVGMAILTLIKGWPAVKKLQLEADGSLRTDLMARITKLEADAITERSRRDTIEGELRTQISDLQHELMDVRSGRTRR